MRIGLKIEPMIIRRYAGENQNDETVRSMAANAVPIIFETASN